MFGEKVREEGIDESSGLSAGLSGDDRLVFIVKGNPAFVRLFTLVLNDIPDVFHQALDPGDLESAVRSRRPDVVVVIESEDAYHALRAAPVLKGSPILFVAVSDLDKRKTPALAEGDLSWVLKNNPAELHELLKDAVFRPQGKLILCVDDSPTVLRQIKKAFFGTPYELVTAQNGREALDLLDSISPDLILTDVEMPVMDGLTFCARVRARPETAEVPLIILSSRVDYETIASGFDSGADEYLTKPFFPDELLNKVESYLVPPPVRRKERVLVVNNIPNVTHLLRLALDKQGFEVSIASDPSRAFDVACRDNPDLIIADADLPGMSGFHFCTQVRSLPETKKIPLVLMTEKTSSGARKMGQKVGVTAYLTKPFTREGVITLVERLLAENRSLRALEWDMVLASITSLARALDERDPYTRFHSENVARYAMAIGRKSGLNAHQLENLRLAGLLHDIGKIGIPDKILHKPDKLTGEEFEKVKQHSRLGAEILQPIPALEEVAPAILHHHERMDGKGYPGGLKGPDIPVLAKILAVADTFDALVTDRPYRKGLSRQEAVAIMRNVSGTQLFPRYVNLFCEWLAESS
ncbi:MAG: response regulator [Pseudomonadota bacterium]